MPLLPTDKAGQQLLARTLETEEPASPATLAEELGVPEERVAGLLKMLEREGLLTMKRLIHGLSLRATPRGVMALKAARLAGKEGEALLGVVTSGLGEGKYYLSIDQYKEVIGELLGGEPFPGTLNLVVKEGEKRSFLGRLPASEVKSFTMNRRRYGSVTFFPVRISTERCGVIIPRRSRHDERIVEVVAKVSLRALLGLKDGDEVLLEPLKEGVGGEREQSRTP